MLLSDTGILLTVTPYSVMMYLLFTHIQTHMKKYLSIIGSVVIVLAITIVLAVSAASGPQERVKSAQEIEIEFIEARIAERGVRWQLLSASGTLLQQKLQEVSDEMRKLEELNVTARKQIQLLRGGAQTEPVSFVPRAYAEAPIIERPKVKNIEVPKPAVIEVVSEPIKNDTGQEDYKVLRLREMAELIKGTNIEKHTVKLLAMLITEDGTVTAERRHDCKGGTCFAIGIQGHHICHRGTPLVSQDHGKPFKKFCTWADEDGDGKYETSPLAQFEKEYPGFAFDWRVQYAEYVKRMSGCIGDGYSVNACVQAWNSKEEGRIAKVEGNMGFVRKALAF